MEMIDSVVFCIPLQRGKQSLAFVELYLVVAGTDAGVLVQSN